MKKNPVIFTEKYLTLLVNIEINSTWLVAFLRQFQVNVYSGFESEFSSPNAHLCCKLKPQNIQLIGKLIFFFFFNADRKDFPNGFSA